MSTERITPAMTQSGILNNLNAAMSRLQTTSNQMASGLRITQPSDDPYGASVAVALNGSLSGLNSYANNVDDGTSWTTTADGSLTDINNIVQSVRELVVEASNGTESQEDRNSAAQEVDQLTDEVKQAAQATYNGNYIFSGTATTTPPYQTGSDDTYAGNSEAVIRQIGPGVTTQVNVDLSQVLGNGQGSGDGKLLDVLRNISSDLTGGTTANLQSLSTTDLQGIDSNTATLEQLQAAVGTTSDRLTLASSRIQTSQDNVTAQLATTQDANIAQTTTDYSLEQASYTAALRASADIVQQSLVDFLGSSG